MRIRYAVTLLTLVAAASAGAEIDDYDYSTKETRAIVHAYAKCVVRRHPAKASEALLQDADNSTIRRRYPMLIDGGCLGREAGGRIKASFGGDLYRYALADALVGRELAAAPVPALDSVPILARQAAQDRPQPPAANARKSERRDYEFAVKRHDRAVADAFLGRYGECIVRVDPAGAKALLLTVPDSPEETGGFGRLKPALATCLAEGATLQFGRVSLRGTIALNYYRLAHAAGTMAAGS